MKTPGSAATAAGVLVGVGLAIGILVALIAWPAGHSPSVGEWLIQAALGRRGGRHRRRTSSKKGLSAGAPR